MSRAIGGKGHWQTASSSLPACCGRGVHIHPSRAVYVPRAYITIIYRRKVGTGPAVCRHPIMPHPARGPNSEAARPVRVRPAVHRRGGFGAGAAVRNVGRAQPATKRGLHPRALPARRTVRRRTSAGRGPLRTEAVAGLQSYGRIGV